MQRWLLGAPPGPRWPFPQASALCVTLWPKASLKAEGETWTRLASNSQQRLLSPPAAGIPGLRPPNPAGEFLKPALVSCVCRGRGRLFQPWPPTATRWARDEPRAGVVCAPDSARAGAAEGLPGVPNRTANFSSARPASAPALLCLRVCRPKQQLGDLRGRGRGQLSKRKSRA